MIVLCSCVEAWGLALACPKAHARVIHAREPGAPKSAPPALPQALPQARSALRPIASRAPALQSGKLEVVFWTIGGPASSDKVSKSLFDRAIGQTAGENASNQQVPTRLAVRYGVMRTRRPTARTTYRLSRQARALLACGLAHALSSFNLNQAASGRGARPGTSAASFQQEP